MTRTVDVGTLHVHVRTCTGHDCVTAVVPTTTRQMLVLSSLNTLQCAYLVWCARPKARLWGLEVTTYSAELHAMVFPSLWEPLEIHRVSHDVCGYRLREATNRWKPPSMTSESSAQLRRAIAKAADSSSLFEICEHNPASPRRKIYLHRSSTTGVCAWTPIAPSARASVTVVGV